MSNGNGVTATLSQGVDEVKEVAGNVGETIATAAEDAVASVKKTVKRARKAATTQVAKVKKAVQKAEKTVAKKADKAAKSVGKRLATAKKKLETAKSNAKAEAAALT